MKTSSFLLILTVLISSYCILACEKTGYINYTNHESDDSTISTREQLDCAECYYIEACCCTLRLNTGTSAGDYDFTICGVSPATAMSPCTLSTENGPCYTLNNRGFDITLNPSGPIEETFCIDPNSAFAIHYLNTSGTVNAHLSCNGGGTTGLIFTPYTAGSGYYLYYILLDECDPDFPCDI